MDEQARAGSIRGLSRLQRHFEHALERLAKSPHQPRPHPKYQNRDFPYEQAAEQQDITAESCLIVVEDDGLDVLGLERGFLKSSSLEQTERSYWIRG